MTLSAALPDTPEHRLLLQCARSRVPESARVHLEALTRRVSDWNDFVALAESHCVSDLLITSLTVASAHVPASVLDDLDRRFVGLTAQNLARTKQLADLLALFEAHGIRAVAFRGPALAAGVYGHLGLRSSTDLDVLVDPRAVLRVRPLMLAHGYALPSRRKYRGGSLLYGVYPPAGRSDTLVPTQPGLTEVDVHTAFAFWEQGIRLDTRGLLQRAVTIRIAGMPIPTLSPGDLLLVLAIHGMLHGYIIFRLVTDIEAVARYVDEWDDVVDRARSAGMLRVLWVALLLAHHLLEADVPSHIVALAERDERAMTISREIAARVFDPAAMARAASTWDPKTWFRRFMDRPQDRMRAVVRRTVFEWFLKWPWDEWLGRRGSP